MTVQSITRSPDAAHAGLFCSESYPGPEDKVRAYVYSLSSTYPLILSSFITSTPREGVLLQPPPRSLEKWSPLFSQMSVCEGAKVSSHDSFNPSAAWGRVKGEEARAHCRFHPLSRYSDLVRSRLRGSIKKAKLPTWIKEDRARLKQG